MTIADGFSLAVGAALAYVAWWVFWVAVAVGILVLASRR